MSTLSRVTCPKGVWTEISGDMVEGVSYSLQTNGTTPFAVCEKATTPTDTDSRILVDVRRHYILPARYMGVKLWARPTEVDCNEVVVEITEAGTLGQPVMPVDDEGNLETIKQDQHTEVIDLKLHQILDEMTLLANYSIGVFFINVETTGDVPIIGDSICLKESTAFYQAEVLAVTPIAGNQYTLRLDIPTDFAFTTDAFACLNNDNMAVDGSVTPVLFRVSPANLTAGVEWDLTRFMLSFRGAGYGTPPNNQPDDAGFGTMGPLTNGIYIRSVNGITKNLFNAKTNFDLKSRMYDIDYSLDNKNGEFGARGRRSINGDDKNGVTIRLEAVTEDEFQLWVNDDLTDMTEMVMVVQGHVVDV